LDELYVVGFDDDRDRRHTIELGQAVSIVHDPKR
jgi:hypothetical protein